MGRQLGRCKKCNCQATIDERDDGICIWCAARKLENEDISWLLAERDRIAAELARVKAESLRVVKVKSGNEINIGAFVRHIFLDGKPVRLERWEEQG